MPPGTLRRVALAVAVLLALVTLAAAEPITWRLANEYPATSLPGEGDAHFARLVEERSGGRIRITVHPDAALGFRSKDQLTAVANGAVPLADTLMGAVGTVEPVFLLPSLPFVAPTAADARTLFEVARADYERALTRFKQKLLYVTPWPPSGIWAKTPITSVDALRGLRIRTYDASGTLAFRAAGARPAQISFADAQAKLKAGAIDAVLSSGDGGSGARLWELLPHFTAIGYAMPLSMTTINLGVWDALPPDLQHAVLDAAEATSERQWAGAGRRVAANYERMRANGMTITTEVPDDVLAALRKAGRLAAADWLARTAPRGQEILEAFEKRSRPK